MKVILSQVSRHRAAAGGGRTVIKHSAVEDSKGNGVVERVVKSIEDQTRVAKSATEMWIGAKIEPEHAVMIWLIEYVSMLFHRYKVGRYGRTAFKRNRNKSSKLIGLEFGECVKRRRRLVGSNLAKLAVLWDVGVYLGVKGSVDRRDHHWEWRRRVANEDGEAATSRVEVEDCGNREDEGVALRPRGREEGGRGREAWRGCPRSSCSRKRRPSRRS